MLLVSETAYRTGRVGAVLLAALAVLWLYVSNGMEGIVLLAVTSSHGLTSTDFVALAGLGLAAWRWRSA